MVVVLYWSDGSSKLVDVEGMPCRVVVAMDGAACVTSMCEDGVTIVDIEATVPRLLVQGGSQTSGGGL